MPKYLAAPLVRMYCCLMGLFDTIHLQEPLVCPHCGAKESSLQTHELGDSMATYRVGSVLRMTPVLTGIVKESLWCSSCHKAGREKASSPVYLVIWNSILAGVTQDLAQAETRLASVDRLDLIAWLDEAQRDSARWRRSYWDLFSDVEQWHRHQTEPEPDPENGEKRPTLLSHFLSLPDEILNAPDPLAAILEKSQESAKNNPDATGDAWF